MISWQGIAKIAGIFAFGAVTGLGSPVTPAPAQLAQYEPAVQPRVLSAHVQADPATPAPTVTPTPAPAVAATPAATPAVTPAPARVYYASCAAARQAGAAPLKAGDPGYRRALDYNRDGVACD